MPPHLAAAELARVESVVDLYCGAGTLSLVLARSAAEVIGVENVADAVVRARRNAELNGIGTARFVEGESRRVLRAWARGELPGPRGADVVVVDRRAPAPPARGGPDRRARPAACGLRLLQSRHTGAGRQGLRNAGYVLGEVEPFDMFPPYAPCRVRGAGSTGSDCQRRDTLAARLCYCLCP
jgi:23S rRNA (uracil1939-C5)-methyltransferase